MDRHSVTNPVKLLATTLLAALLLLLTMGFLFYQGNQLASRHAPLVDAAMEIKLEATLGHLWLEEMISGDRAISLEVFLQHLERVEWYINAMLEGGRNQEGTFYPLNDPALRKSIISVRKKLEKFRQIALIRYQGLAESVAGSDIDQRFDQLFQAYIDEADQVETLLQARIRHELRNYYYLGSALLLVSVVISILLGRFLYHREIDKARLIKSLSDSHREIRKKNQELDYRAHFDDLTGLPNRVLFVDRLERLIADSKRNGLAFSLLFIDLDNFKTTNDLFGHQIGDKLLQHVAARIKRCIREEDTLTRLAGDEFVVMLNAIDSAGNAMTAAKTIANKVLHELDQPYLLENVKTYVTASIGISIYPVDSSIPEKLLQCADTAMYHAKSLGRNQYAFHSVEQSDSSQRKNAIEHDLREAIQQQRLEIHYQPIWHLDSGAIYALEALVRWQHPNQGLILPQQLIPVAESCGLISQIDFLVLRHSLAGIRGWRQKGLDFERVSINISAQTFHQSDFASKILGEMTEQGIDGSDIELEITEQALSRNSTRTRTVLQNLRKLGVTITLDDFGSDLASLTHLQHLPINNLKIDKKFIVGEEGADLVLKNIVQLGEDLGLNIIAKGIETTHQETGLREKGCHIGQGNLFSRPLSDNEIPVFFDLADAENILFLNARTT